MAGPRIPSSAWIAAAVLAAASLGLHVSAGRDDAYITYWAARMLADVGEIWNYNGERVEQSSSLLFTALLAAVRRVTGAEPETAGPLLSQGFGIALVLFVGHVAARRGFRWPALAALLTATYPSVVYWSASGMESTLAALLGLWVLERVRCLRWQRGPCGQHVVAGATRLSAAIVLFVLVRPEAGLVLLGALSLYVLLDAGLARSPDPAQRVNALGALFFTLLVMGAAAAGRWALFGQIQPQPVHAKATISAAALLYGLHYAAGAVTLFVLPLVVCLGLRIVQTFHGLAHGCRREPAELLLACYVLVYLGLLMLAGGDWMEAGRLLVPIVPAAVLLAARVPSGFSGRSVLLAGSLMVALQLAGAVRLAHTGSTGMPLWQAIPRAAALQGSGHGWFERANRNHGQDMRSAIFLQDLVGRIADRQPGPVRILSGQMGLVVYHVAREHFGRIRTMDRYGLVDRTFLDCPITAALPRLPNGLQLYYGFYFKNAGVLKTECRIEPPEIVYDVWKDGRDRAVRAGYRVVYEARAAPESTLLGGRWPGRYQFVALRADVAARLALAAGEKEKSVSFRN
jgi:hypothetical protein